MALHPCRECRREVSTEAKLCPHCGVASPAPKAATSGGAYGCLLIVVILAVVGGISNCYNSITESRAKDRQQAAVVEQQNARLTSVTAYLTRADTSEATRSDPVAIETILHDSASVPTLPDSLARRHAALHPVGARRMLDSAAGLLKAANGRDAAPGLAQPLLRMAAAGPMASADSTRHASLTRTMDAQLARIRKEAKQIAAQLAITQRKTFAKQLERKYLDDGMDITVTTRGANATTLRIKWILVSRVLAHQFSKNGELFQNLRNAGFTRLEITDGYDEEWYWTL